MTAANDICKRSDARFDERVVHVFAHVSRRRAVEWQVPAFGADAELFTRKTVLACECFQGLANRTLAALETVIGGAVDNVTTKLNRAHNSVRVASIRSLVGVAEIRADPD